MKIEVLISTMAKNEEEIKNLIEKMNIQTDCIIINQCNVNKEYKLVFKKIYKAIVIFTTERGLSRSRNMAIRRSTADICMLADDDMIYLDDYKKVVLKSYENHPEIDIIGHFVATTNEKKMNKKKNKFKKISFIGSMKISSVQISFKRNAIERNKILFDTDFGTGSKRFIMGEENIFLYDCLKKKLKIAYNPILIARLDESDSTWFTGYNEQYFISKGAAFYRMSSQFGLLYILQFAMRKHKLYKNEMNFLLAVKYMYQGLKMLKKNY